MARLRLSNLFWLVLACAIVVAWWKDHLSLLEEIDALQRELQSASNRILIL